MRDSQDRVVSIYGVSAAASPSSTPASARCHEKETVLNVARLHVIYSLLLAHCFSLDEAVAPQAAKRFGPNTIATEMLGLPQESQAPPPPLPEDRVYSNLDPDDCIQKYGGEVYKEMLRTCKMHWLDFLIKEAITWRDLRAPADQAAAFDEVLPSIRACRDYERRLRHLDKTLGMFDAYEEHLNEIGAEYRPRAIGVRSIPSNFGLLFAASWLARHFDLTNVPGFYQEDPIAELLPGAPVETQLLDAAKRWLDVVHAGMKWRINLTGLKGALLVPYDNGTGYILGIQIYRSVRDRAPFLLSSRGKPCGASAVALGRRQE